jgi:hypothetical protein
MTIETDIEVRHAEAVANIDVALLDVDRRLAGLDDKRRKHAVDAAAGSKSALQAVAACDAESDKLCRERRTLVLALEQLEVQLNTEREAAADKDTAARRTRAAAAARNVGVFNAQIDDLLAQLALVLSQRFEALRELARTDVVDRSLISKMQGKNPLTNAAHYHGLQALSEAG